MPRAGSIDKNEKKRLKQLTLFEEDARTSGFRKIAGIDEAGRGPLAGPVVAAACIIPQTILLSGVDDSKKLTARQREDVFERICKDSRIQYGIGIIEPALIDEINILQATIRAMLMAVSLLPDPPDYLLVDGMQLTQSAIPSQKIIKGDAKSQSIAAASIIAKVTRDRLMCEYDKAYPQYGFSKHKGYGTAEHLLAIRQFGPCLIHRLTFEPIKSMEKLHVL